MNKINKIKIVTVVGTRPEIIRLSSVINRLNKSKSIDHFLIHTGQNYDHNLNDVFFKDLDILKPNYYLDAAKETPTKTIGEILIKIDPILDEIDPDAILVLGDTNSCLSVISAKKKKIPIFHLEAGNRCFDMRVPEETNRRIVDHISDINLTYSSIAREHLINEGIKSDRIINVGSPMFEVLQKHKQKIKRSKIIDKLKINKNKYILVSCHREENIDNDKNFESLTETLNCLANNYKLDIIFSAHPRTRKKFELKKPKLNKLVKLIEPLGFIDYNNLQINSYVVLSDSGTISEESSILNFKAVNIRESHERPEAMEEASVILSGLNYNRIIQSIESIKDQKEASQRNILLVKEYNVPNLSIKIERIILSYINYINRVVWQKEF
jgi:UDP-N-acetylglucosamine 2-epimerase (non-hydrolysing)